ncbi:hypothetical protein [Streptomyces sp. NPDC002671]
MGEAEERGDVIEYGGLVDEDVAPAELPWDRSTDDAVEFGLYGCLCGALAFPFQQPDAFSHD